MAHKRGHRPLADAGFLRSSDIIPSADKSLGWAWRPPPSTNRALSIGLRKLRGEPTPKQPEPKPMLDPDKQHVPLKELCRLANTTPKQARVKLRESNYPRPRAGWIFPRSDVDKILEIIS